MPKSSSPLKLLFNQAFNQHRKSKLSLLPMNHQHTMQAHSSVENIQSLKDEIIDQVETRIADTLDSLPVEYFEQLQESERLEHLKAIVALKVCNINQEIVLKEKSGSRVSVISCENYPGQLARLLKDLPNDYPLVSAKIFTSVEEDFIVDVFEFQTNPFDHKTDSTQPSERRSEVVDEAANLAGADQNLIETFMNQFHPNSEILDSAEEIADHWLSLQMLDHANDIKVQYKPERLAPKENKSYAKISISASSSTTREVMERAAMFFGQCKFDIRRAFCENIVDDKMNNVALLTFHVAYHDETLSESRSNPPQNNDSKKRFDRNLVTDPKKLIDAMEFFLRVDAEVIAQLDGSISRLSDLISESKRSEVLCGLSKLTQYKVHFCNAMDISHERILRSLSRNPAFTQNAIDRLLGRFHNTKSSDGHTGDASDDQIDHSLLANLDAVGDATDRLILETFAELAKEIQRCNVHLQTRRVLAFRLSGQVFENLNRGETPFAVYYVYGNGFDGMHVRFRDVSRGGMRLVPTRNDEHYVFESSRVFDETWRLASAQQLKNKDIAEGGSKAVVVIKPEFDSQKAGRDFVDGLFDLMVGKESINAIDQPPVSPEFLYLGPDENVSDELIDWIVQRSRQRQYSFPNAIMSSKRHSGINHKAYGVTSEGVLVFLRYALSEYGIDPAKDSFTIKLTGGPDGDVGGNAIRILIRDYQDRAKIVGVSDGTGSAIDENGLEQTELLRLVDSGLGIASFSSERLSQDGSVFGLKNETDITRRNNMHNHVASDVFLPAGGRPSTINGTNWVEFLDKSGKPSSRIIVEGANLFITDDARKELSNRGVAIIKDSSANKCGVICSSLEIIAGMMLEDDEFIEMKSAYVTEVLESLRDLAGTEAICLFNEKLRRPKMSLPEISVEISRQIIRLADTINSSIEDWSEQEHDLANEIIVAFLPNTLVQKLGNEMVNSIPANYRQQLIAAVLSSRIVYREGCQGLSSMLEADLERLVRSHLVYENQTRRMVNQISEANLINKDAIIQMLDYAGARAQRDLRMPLN